MDKIEQVCEDITEYDIEIFFQITSNILNPYQREKILNPTETYPYAESVLAVHWHPEQVPMDIIQKRIDRLFPNRKYELIIPTQHNIITSYGEYSGVEVDCYSKGFDQKVQLLLHFKNEKLDDANVLKEMLSKTFKYRSSQLFDFMRSITKPIEDRVNKAAKISGANEETIHFIRIYVKKIEKLLERYESVISSEMLKNRLLTDFFDNLENIYGNTLIDLSQDFLNEVKKIVKANFPLKEFYRTSEIIEEARSLGAGIIIPHPEQFWPILLANYNIDGIEVWNPKSQRYTEFLISVINDKNAKIGISKRNLMVFMGDDTHMGKKVMGEKKDDIREIGVQQGWDIFKVDKKEVIKEYKSRLN
ncbi:MAG: hypothetical protein HQK79_01680 [Desulfobacterales bacterium]|nr:hypothetical protein [Desulfobacterales bacterium]